MSATMKNKKTANKKKINAIVDPEVDNYEKHPFFIKKANEAKGPDKTGWFTKENG